jgi:hypothetical protein
VENSLRQLLTNLFNDVARTRRIVNSVRIYFYISIGIDRRIPPRARESMAPRSCCVVTKIQNRYGKYKKSLGGHSVISKSTGGVFLSFSAADSNNKNSNLFRAFTNPLDTRNVNCSYISSSPEKQKAPQSTVGL